MFSPDERTIGGAFLIQQEFQNGMCRFINRVRTTPSQYAPSSIPLPFKKPSAPKFLATNFRRIDPRFCVGNNNNSSNNVRPTSSSSSSRFLGRRASHQQNVGDDDGDRNNNKCSMFTSRINNDTPTSFAFSLQNRKREVETKKIHQEVKEARRPHSARGREEARERRHEEIQHKVLQNRPDWDETSLTCTSTNKFIRSYHDHIASLTLATEATMMANAATETGDEKIAELVDDQNKSRVVRPAMPSTEMHGLRSLLADCCREEQTDKIKRRQTEYLQDQKKQRQIQLHQALLQKLEYNGDGMSKFMVHHPENEETKKMLFAHFSRCAAADEEKHQQRLAKRTSNHFPGHQDHNNNKIITNCMSQHPPAGALVKEAAKRILQRVDCMGSRVKEYHRNNIATSLSHIVSVRHQTDNNDNNNNAHNFTNLVAAHEISNHAIEEDLSHQQQQQQQKSKPPTSPTHMSNVVPLVRKNSKLTFVAATDEQEKIQDATKDDSSDDLLEDTRASASTPPPPSNEQSHELPSITLTNETPNHHNSSNEDSSSRQKVIVSGSSSSNNQQQKPAIVYSDDDEGDDENQQQQDDSIDDHIKAVVPPSTLTKSSSSAAPTATTRVPAPPIRKQSSSLSSQPNLPHHPQNSTTAVKQQNHDHDHPADSSSILSTSRNEDDDDEDDDDDGSCSGRGDIPRIISSSNNNNNDSPNVNQNHHHQVGTAEGSPVSPYESGEVGELKVNPPTKFVIG